MLLFSLCDRIMLQMDYDPKIMLLALKYVSGETNGVCRLCFTSTENEEVSLDDSLSLQLPDSQESVTYSEMLKELGVPGEPILPQVMCANCATITFHAYLFQKLVYSSNERWYYICDRFNNSLNKTNTLGSNINVAYLFIDHTDDKIITSKNKQYKLNKKTALAKIKGGLKSKKSYSKSRKTHQIICEECGDILTSKGHLMRHNMSVHSKTKHPCTQCIKTFPTQILLAAHIERIHMPKKIHCSKCTKVFSTYRMLKYHNSVNHIPVKCKLCSKQFPSKKDLRVHLQRHEINKCERCNKSFATKKSYEFHTSFCGIIVPCHRVPSFFCDICNKGYARKNGLRSHLVTDHGFGSVLSCEWCNKKFDAISKLNNHIVKHTRERKFSCEQCGKKFVTQAALVYHIRLHTGEKPYPCEKCGESFLSSSRRMEHMRRKHIGPTKECHICHAKFVTRYQLREHTRRHFNPQSKLFVPENQYIRNKLFDTSHILEEN